MRGRCRSQGSVPRAQPINQQVARDGLTKVQFVGLSGVIHGLLLYCMVRDVKQHRWLWGVSVLLVIKVIAELLGWRPAHFVGDDVALIHAAGLLSAVVLLKLERRRLSDAVPHKD